MGNSMRTLIKLPKRAVAVLASVLTALVIWVLLPHAGAQGQAPAKTTNESSPAFTRAGYIPDRQCAACHRAIYRTFRDVGMAKSFYRPRSDDIIEDFDNNHFFHEPSNRHYEMIHDAGRFVMRRYQLDEDGQRINEIQQPIDWVIGSGSHSRGYLYQTEVGELFELPVVWYTQEQSWGMAPGYDHANHDGVTRRITRACMFCHNAYPDVPPGSDRYGQPHVFPSTLPEGVGCQRCHGPGAAHIRLAADLDASNEAVRASIVNPAKLPPKLRDDVCFQCHLQPTSKLTSFMRRFGRDDYSYRPGESLSDYLVHLDFDDAMDRSERFEINHHPYRLRQSTCYVASNGELNCLTCHDPHRKVPATEAPTYYRDRCLSCHEIDDCRLDEMAVEGATGRDIAADNCIACHMPKRRTQDVVHVVMTDHRIQRRPVDDLLAPQGETAPPGGEKIELYWSNHKLPEPMATAHRAMSVVVDGDVSALEALETALATDSPTPREPLIELGTGQLRAGRYDDALATFRAVAKREPDLALASANIGVALAAMERDREAIELLNRAVELDPDVADTHYNLAAAYARVGQTEAAQRYYREALRLRPNYVNAWFNLGNLLARKGRFADAASAYRSALAIEPNTPAAYRNLGLALSYLDSWPEAVRAWRIGARAAPDDGRIATELALAYLLAPDESVRNAANGLRYAQQATATRERAPKARLALAIGMLMNDQAVGALRETEKARELGADEISCLLVHALAEHNLQRDEAAGETYSQVLSQMEEARPPNRIRDALLERAEEVFDQ